MYYTIDDGRIWDVDQAKFIASLPEGTLDEDVIQLWCNGHVGDVDYLKRTLVFYGYTIGDELKTYEERASDIRAKRDALLAETDWMVLPDAKVANKDAVLEYRQALRDVPSQKGFPAKVTWPTL